MRTLTSILTLFLGFILNGQDLDLEVFAQNLNSPVNIKHAGDNRLFVAEQNGTIKIVEENGTVLPTAFLDIDDRVYDVAFFGDERGLLGLVFHPDYATNGYFFVNYINNTGNTVISRFERDANNPNLANPASELIFLTIDQPAYNHNGGDMHFGTDGFLYIGVGDGGFAGDPFNNAQNLNTLLGKILRIDVDNSTTDTEYAIPSDNPFISNPNALDEIWAYGIRNPWKFSFDSLTDDLWMGDVGQNGFEEINRVNSTDAGLNYGWRCYEGNSVYNNSPDCPELSETSQPAMVYAHTAGRCAVTGGFVYRGSTYSNFDGLYFFADYCSDEIGYLAPNGNDWDIVFNDFFGAWSAFGEDINGELYISELISGTIYKLIDTSLSVEDQSISSISIYPNPVKSELTISFPTGAAHNNITINIYDVTGKCVKTVLENEDTLLTINTNSLTNGVYILKIETENGEQNTSKLVINK